MQRRIVQLSERVYFGHKTRENKTSAKLNFDCRAGTLDAQRNIASVYECVCGCVKLADWWCNRRAIHFGYFVVIQTKGN